MAKKKAEIKANHIHKDCTLCKPVTHEFLNYTGQPIMGECEFMEHRFLLNEKTDCKHYG